MAGLGHVPHGHDQYFEGSAPNAVLDVEASGTRAGRHLGRNGHDTG
jgi:hypothetical protein